MYNHSTENKSFKIFYIKLFAIIYKYVKGKTQNEHFDNALKKLDNIQSIWKSKTTKEEDKKNTK